jgi:hypothetical protein
MKTMARREIFYTLLSRLSYFIVLNYCVEGQTDIVTKIVLKYFVSDMSTNNPLHFGMDTKMVDMSPCQHFATQKFL